MKREGENKRGREREIIERNDKKKNGPVIQERRKWFQVGEREREGESNPSSVTCSFPQ